jgi:hypothetical protein
MWKEHLYVLRSVMIVSVSGLAPSTYKSGL